MNKFFKIIRRLYTRPVEVFNNIFIRPKLNDEQVLGKFYQLSTQYDQTFSLFSAIGALERGSNGYSWDSWSGKIRSVFLNGVNLAFLSQPLIRFTMVLGGRGNAVHDAQLRIVSCLEIFGEETTKNLLIEDYIGLPIISDAKFMTSANRAHHASHLAYYYKLMGRNVWDSISIVEWGGGYGNMARIIRRMNPKITYTIVDLPELLSLQYVYLGSIEGIENVNIVASEGDTIASGKINLISSELLLSDRFLLSCDLFISTWAITECPAYIQEFVNEKEYFNAEDVFIASRIDENNRLQSLISQKVMNKLTVPYLNEHHEYWAINRHDASA